MSAVCIGTKPNIKEQLLNITTATDIQNIKVQRLNIATAIDTQSIKEQRLNIMTAIDIKTIGISITIMGNITITAIMALIIIIIIKADII